MTGQVMHIHDVTLSTHHGWQLTMCLSCGAVWGPKDQYDLFIQQMLGNPTTKWYWAGPRWENR